MSFFQSIFFFVATSHSVRNKFQINFFLAHKNKKKSSINQFLFLALFIFIIFLFYLLTPHTKFTVSRYFQIINFLLLFLLVTLSVIVQFLFFIHFINILIRYVFAISCDKFPRCLIQKWNLTKFLSFFSFFFSIAKSK